jgi:phytoene dehydrogenase-like protein
MSVRSYDAVVVGGGLGGLLAAAAIAKHGGTVLVLERLRYIGGRFTTVPQDGCEITTGALHMAPHGDGGALAQVMASLGIPFRTVPRDMYASFLTGGRHVLWRRPWDILALFRPKARAELVKIVLKMKFDKGLDNPLRTFPEWLARQTDDELIYRIFERFIHFALSIQPDQMLYREMRAIFRSLRRYGMPGIPVGGCKSVIENLADFITARRGTIRADTEVVEILFDRESDRVTGVRFRDRQTGCEEIAYGRKLISDIGPEATVKLIGDAPDRLLTRFPTTYTRASGLKLHIVSDKSLIPHNSIMFCLDTKRICGMVEVSRAVPSVTPPGMHMIDTFQVWMSDDFVVERDLAIEDLRQVFGSDFDRHCRIARASAFRGKWPVNHIIQGQDAEDQEPIPGLLMVGDAYKPSGHIMVEGVAASVSRLSETLAR